MIFSRRLPIKISLFDILIICFYMYELLLIFTGINSMPTFICFTRIHIIIVIYFILRASLTKTSIIKELLLTISIFTCFLSVFAIISFSNVANSIYDLKLNSNITDFKFLFTPLGLMLNNWSSFLLISLCFQILCLYMYKDQKKNFIIIYFCIICSVFLLINSFIRGIYICLLIYSLFIAYFFYRKKMDTKVKRLLFFSILLIIGLSLPFHGGIIKTLKIFKTESQIRSLNSRVSIINEIFPVFIDKPYLGVGSSNFTQAKNTYNPNKANDTISNFQGNTIYQILIEKGIIGTILILCIFLYSIYILLIYKKNDKLYRYLILYTLIVSFVRELTYPSLFNHFECLLLLVVLLGITHNQFYAPKIFLKINLKYRMILGVPIIIVCSIVTFLLTRHHKNNLINELFLIELNKNNLNEAEEYIEMTDLNIATIINRSIVNWEKYKESGKKEYLDKTKLYMVEALKLNPSDVILIYNLAQIHKKEGNIDQYRYLISSLIDKYHGKLLFLIEKYKMETSIENLYNILINYPDFSDTKYWINTVKIDKQTEEILKTYIVGKKRDIDDTNDPILYAKYGKLLLWENDLIGAKYFLEKSLLMLPNLIEPRYNLSIIEYNNGNNELGNFYMKQYNFITKKRSISTSKENNKNYCLDKSYPIKFRSWYGYSTSPEKAIFFE